MEVNGRKGLVSMVVQSYVEEGVHMHMVGLVGNYKGFHGARIVNHTFHNSYH